MQTSPSRPAVRVMDIAVHLHWSLLLVLGIVAWDAGTRFRAVTDSPLAALGLALATGLGMLAGILVHELAHARRGHRHGVRVHGVHLFVIGGVTVMDDTVDGPGDEFRIAAVGPWRSLQVAAALGLVTAALDWFGLAAPAAAVLGQVAWFNLALGMFNLLPAAPLDGGRMLQAAVWRLTGSRRTGMRTAAAAGVALGVGLWGLAGWVVLRTTATAPTATARWTGYGAAAWTMAVAAFVAALAVVHWRRSDDVDGPPAPTLVDGAATAATAPGAVAEPSQDPGAAATTRPTTPPRWRRVTAGVAGTAVVVAAAIVVPMPWVLQWPGPRSDLGTSLRVEDAPGPLHGQALQLTVNLWHAGLLPAAWALVDDDVRLQSRVALIPPGVGDRAWFARQGEVFDRSLESAAAAAFAHVGEPVTIETTIVVRGVLPGTPADGVLRPGDEVVAIDGRETIDLDGLAATTASLQVGDQVAVTVDRAGTRLDLEVGIASLPGADRAGMGVTLGPVVDDLQLPRAVASTTPDVGGPSAGLTTAIAVVDLVSEQDVLAGRVVAATGTMSAVGEVGAIGSLPQKVAGAIDAGADLMLVPASQASEATALAEGEVDVVGVASLDEAIAALTDG